MTKPLDLIGRRYGRLLVVAKSEIKKNQKSHWECVCDCGNNGVFVGGDLQSGRTCSCGCFNRQIIANRVDLLGRKFGMLTVIKKTGLREVGNKNRKMFWECLCECGQKAECTSGNLTSGNSYSCGCYKKSVAEKIVSEFLTAKCIEFESQKTFPDCKNKRLLPFDFYIENKFVVECHGRQHYEPIDFFGGSSGFLNRVTTDRKKEAYCKSKQIPFWVIRYDDDPKIKLEEFLERKTK